MFYRAFVIGCLITKWNASDNNVKFRPKIQRYFPFNFFPKNVLMSGNVVPYTSWWSGNKQLRAHEHFFLWLSCGLFYVRYNCEWNHGTLSRVNVSQNIAIVIYNPSQYYLFGGILSFQLVRDIFIWWIFVFKSHNDVISLIKVWL